VQVGRAFGYKAKAKSHGDDIVSAIVEPAAQAIIDTVGK